MHSKTRRLCSSALFLFLPALSAQAATPHFPTSEDLRHLGSIGSPKLSPDGKSVLLEVRESTADGAKSHVWLVDIDTDTARQLTYSPDADRAGERDAAWMPDGSVLFLAHRGEHTQLYRLPMNGGEAKLFDLKTVPVADRSRLPGALPPAGEVAKKDENKSDATKADPMPIDVGSFEVAPDGKTIAILADDPETPGEKKQGTDKADATWVDHDVHGTRLYLLDVATAKLTLTALPIDVREARWGPDSSKLVVLTEEPNNVGDLHPSGAAWMLPAGDPAHPQKLDALPATIEAAAWAKGGRAIAFIAQAKEDTPPGYGDLYEHDLASKRIDDLTDGFEGSVGRSGLIALLNGGIVQLLAQGFDSSLAIFPDAPAKPGNTSKPAFVKAATPMVGSIGTNDRQTGWVFLGQGGTQPTALYYAAKLDGSARMLHTPPTAPEGLNAVAPKLLEWKNEGMTIQGMLYLPARADAAKVPLVVDVHGGPLGAFEDDYDPFVQFLVGHGWAVLRTNPRGSSNYGARFAAANKNDLGGGDYRDIMAGVDYALKNANLDPDKMALMGYSYGGEMAGFVEGSTSRFKAIVSGAPVIDQYSEYGTESESWYDRWYFGKPWEHPQDAWKQSPLSRVTHATTPFLLLQGDDDTTDPLGQSQEMYRALRQSGVPVDLVTYPRVNHGPLAGAIFGYPSPEPWHGYDARRRIVEMLQKSFGEPVDPQ